MAVPMAVRQDLPQEIVSELEERICAKGFFGVLGVIGQAVGSPSVRREVRLIDDRRYEAYTYGSRLSQQTTSDENLVGIAIDGAIALSDRSFRVLEVGERIVATQKRFNTCPVSGRSIRINESPDGSIPAIDESTPAVEIAGEVHYLCDGRHIQLLAEGGTGGPVKPTGPIVTTQSTGVRTVLYMRVAFPETRQEPQSEAAAYAMMKQVNDFMVESSYGNLYLLTTVSPLIVLPRTESWYKSGGGSEFVLQTDAQLVAKKLGYDVSQYDHDIVAYTGGPGTFSGLGYVGSRGIWLRTITAGIASHELGHNFGLWHANSWDTGGVSTIGSGGNMEYGNVFDTMGVASAGDRHFSAWEKSRLNWLPRQSFVHQVHTSGTYRLHAFDQSRLDPGNRYALAISKDRAREYWVEFRQKSFNGNKWVRDGILLNWAPWADSNSGAQLLDTTPGSPDNRDDAAIVIGRTFSDLESGIHITPIGKGGTIPESMDVIVNVGRFPSNHPPLASVAASSLAADVSTSVAFTVVASDPDGDALSYAWDFGDKTFSTSNQPSVSKSWPTPGDYVVRCVVSDMKGLIASDSKIVRVGSPLTYRISGRVMVDGQPLGNVRVSNGMADASYRGAFTDGDGYYTIAGINPGPVALSAVASGFEFSPAFLNPIQIGADFSGADFNAQRGTSISLSVSDSDCTEGGGNFGSFRVARTGSLENSLSVSFFNPPKGSAIAGSNFDYVMSPDLLPDQSLSAHYYVATIPAGQASLEIHLNAIDDTLAEGPETVTLDLVPQASYVIDGSASATITIEDNDSTLPSVTLLTQDGDASEVGDTATLLVSRTGSTIAPLVVNFSVSGTALQGVDYASLGTQITIPSGAASVPLVITPVDDALAEGTETVSVTLSSGAGYFPTGVLAENTGTVNIVDDDRPMVSVVASDDTANEAGGDCGTFLITRSGPTTLPLTLNYAIGGSATHGVDFERLPGVVTIPAGSSAASVTVIPINDSIGEPAQTVSLQLRSGITHVVDGTGFAIVTILDEADPPLVSVGVSDGDFREPSKSGTFRFTTTGTGEGNVTIHYTVSGTASPGSDYVPLAGEITMGKSSTANVDVLPIDDLIPEDDETVSVQITPDAAYTTSLESTATLSLVDDEQSTVSISPSNTAFGESGGVGRFWILRTGNNNAGLDVNYTLGGSATNGVDYQYLPGVIHFPAGVSSVFLDFVPINDSLPEGTESVTVTLGAGAYGIGVGNATTYLADNDTLPVQVKFGSVSGSGSEGVGTVNVPIVLTAPTSAEVSVECVMNGGTASGGIDYSFNNTIVTFAPGETVKNVVLSILDDSLNEPNETVSLRVQNACGAAIPTAVNPATNGSVYTYTISNDDAPPGARIGFAAASGQGSEALAAPLIAVSLSSPQLLTVSVGYSVTGGSASAGADFTVGPATLTFAPGETVKMVPLSIIDDSLQEAAETIVLTLLSPSGAVIGANSSFTYTVNDDDLPSISIQASDAEAGEFGGNDGTFTLTRTGNLTEALNLDLSVSGTALSGVDFDPLPASVSFPVNAATISITLHPIPDLLAEGDESVTVAILPGAGFTLGSQFIATVTIHDLPIDGWRFEKFGALANTASIAGDLADPDHDALSNLLEFGLASDPNGAGSISLPQLSTDAQNAILSYSRPSSAGDVTFTIETRNALGSWVPVGFSEEIVSQQSGIWAVKDRVPLGGAAGMMLRLRVSRPAQ